MSDPRWQPAPEETPADAWERRLDGKILADGCTPAALATELGDIDEDYARELCDEAYQIVIQNGGTEFEIEHFEAAREQLAASDDGYTDDANDSNHDNASQETSDDEIAQLKAAVTPDRAVETTGADGDDSPGSRSGESPSADTSSGTDESGESTNPDQSTVDCDGLEDEVKRLRSDVQELRCCLDAMQEKVDSLVQLCLGDQDALGYTAVDELDDFLTRMQDIEQRVTEHDDQLQMVRVGDSAGRDQPDDRARRIRQTLYRMRDDDGKASMSRDEVDSRLGGGLHRDSVLDAMKRAADGHAAERQRDDRSYTAINGSSDLQPIDSVRFETGTTHGAQSRVVLDLDRATGAEVRHNLTTRNTENGG